jgi:non-homologous end joining protein Ku
LRKLIEEKAKSHTVAATTSPDMSDRVINLMDALEKSLKHARKDAPAKPRRKAL